MLKDLSQAAPISSTQCSRSPIGPRGFELGVEFARSLCPGGGTGRRVCSVCSPRKHPWNESAA